MNILIYLIVAALIGWVATEIMHDRSNLLINIVVAVVAGISGRLFPQPYLQCWDNQRCDHRSNHAADAAGIRHPAGHRQLLPP